MTNRGKGSASREGVSKQEGCQQAGKGSASRKGVSKQGRESASGGGGQQAGKGVSKRGRGSASGHHLDTPYWKTGGFA